MRNSKSWQLLSINPIKSQLPEKNYTEAKMNFENTEKMMKSFEKTCHLPESNLRPQSYWSNVHPSPGKSFFKTDLN